MNGHFQPRDNEKIHLIGQLRYGVSKVLEDAQFAPLDASVRYRVADLITGYGVAESVRHYYDIYHQTNLEGKRVVVQGWGNVAGAAAYYLAQSGAKIVALLDRNYGLLKPDGLTFEEVKRLLISRKGNQLAADAHPDLLPFEEVNEQIWETEADIFIPGAASKLVKQAQIAALIDKGLQVISCGANDPFADSDLFFGPTAQYADERCSVIPDFIANCGMARLFAYLMQRRNVELSDQAFFGDVSQTIRDLLFDVFKHNTSKRHLTETALTIAVKKLMGETGKR